jgi:hypothetical protein
VAWLAKAVLSNEESKYLKTIALELVEICKQLNQLSETMAKLNDKQFLKIFNEDNKSDVSEKQIDKYQLALQKKVDATESEFRY